MQSEQHIDTFDEWIDELLWEPSDVSENTEDSYYVQHDEVLFMIQDVTIVGYKHILYDAFI